MFDSFYSSQAFLRPVRLPKRRENGPEIRAFSHIRFRLYTPDLPRRTRGSAKASGRFREYSHFGETIGGGGFDQTAARPWHSVSTRSPVSIAWEAEISDTECRATIALDSDEFSRPDCREIGICRSDCRARSAVALAL